jgi:ATP/maltotriose-dependent transcriptional regulator MalT
MLQFASARTWWSDPGYEIRSDIANAALRLSRQPDEPCVVYLMSIAPEDHLDHVLDVLAARSTSAEPLSGNDARLYGTAALRVGAMDLALDFLRASISALRDEGRLGLLARSLVIHAFTAAHLGRTETVASDVDEGIRLGLETHQPFFVATAHIARAIYLASRGEADAADLEIGEVERAVLVAPTDAVLAETRHARGLIDLAAGRYDDAWAELRPLFDPADPSYHASVPGWALADLADAATATDRVDEALRVLDQFSTDSVRMKMPWWRIGAAYARAALLAHGDDLAAAQAAFAAARAMDLDRWPLARARLALAHGMLLRRNRRAAEARVELRSARDLFDAMGVRHLADRARDELRASGENSRRRTFDALDELTPQELQIARLAADGLSNREIGARLYLSHRTVGSHLYRVFPKLGVTSRSQLHQVVR